MIQALHVGQHREVRDRFFGRGVARQRDAVEAVAADHEARGAVDHRGVAGVVERRVERRHGRLVVPHGCHSE